MMGREWIEIMSVVLLSSVKLAMGGVPLALIYGFSFWETVIAVSSGGILGVFAFVYLSKFLVPLINTLLKKILNEDRVFTRSKRRLIRIKQRYGLPGIILLTPSLISIPIGCLLAVKFFKGRTRITIFMILSVIGWTLLLSCIQFLF